MHWFSLVGYVQHTLWAYWKITKIVNPSIDIQSDVFFFHEPVEPNEPNGAQQLVISGLTLAYHTEAL